MPPQRAAVLLAWAACSRSVAHPETHVLEGVSEVLGGSDVLEGVSEVLGGSEVLEGLSEVLGGSEVLESGSEVLEGVSEVLEGGVEVLGGSEVLESGSEVLEGGSEVLEGGSEVLQSGSEVYIGGALHCPAFTVQQNCRGNHGRDHSPCNATVLDSLTVQRMHVGLPDTLWGCPLTRHTSPGHTSPPTRHLSMDAVGLEQLRQSAWQTVLQWHDLLKATTPALPSLS
eukprot:355964-Chlamydomonas_euryale.AAC.1